MRHIMLAVVIAAGVSLSGFREALAVPASLQAISEIADQSNPIIQVRWRKCPPHWTYSKRLHHCVRVFH